LELINVEAAKKCGWHGIEYDARKNKAQDLLDSFIAIKGFSEEASRISDFGNGKHRL